jgi:hypothetical protein
LERILEQPLRTMVSLGTAPRRLPASDLALRFDDLVDLPIDAERHSFPKL